MRGERQRCMPLVGGPSDKRHSWRRILSCKRLCRRIFLPLHHPHVDLLVQEHPEVADALHPTPAARGQIHGGLVHVHEPRNNMDNVPRPQKFAMNIPKSRWNTGCLISDEGMVHHPAVVVLWPHARRPLQNDAANIDVAHVRAEIDDPGVGVLRLWLHGGMVWVLASRVSTERQRVSRLQMERPAGTAVGGSEFYCRRPAGKISSPATVDELAGHKGRHCYSLRPCRHCRWKYRCIMGGKSSPRPLVPFLSTPSRYSTSSQSPPTRRRSAGTHRRAWGHLHSARHGRGPSQESLGESRR